MNRSGCVNVYMGCYKNNNTTYFKSFESDKQAINNLSSIEKQPFEHGQIIKVFELIVKIN